MKNRMGALTGIGITALFLMVLARFGFFDWPQIFQGVSNAGIFLRSAFPPDFQILAGVLPALLETVQMAFAGTLLGFLIAFPLAVFGLRMLAPAFVVSFIRLITGFMRTVPALLWAVLFVIIVGLGPLAGTLSIAFYSVGYFAKLYGDYFEGTDPEVLEAVRGVGAPRIFLLRYVILPEGANMILSQLLFMFEYNIRASSILGFVGAGGIGFQIYVYMQSMEYQRLSAVLILILGIVLVMDFAGRRIRSRCLLQASGF